MSRNSHMCMPRWHYRRVHHWLRHGHEARAGTGYGYSGWVMGGLYRVLPTDRASVTLTAKRAPEALLGAGVGGQGVALPGTSGDHPCGARSCLQHSLSPPRANPASWPIGTRFDLISHKVSQKPQSVTEICRKGLSYSLFPKRAPKVAS